MGGILINPYAHGAGGGSPTDPNFANVVSLLHFDGSDASTTFTDVIGKTWTPAGNAQLSTTDPKFGTACGLFDGNDIISTPNHADFDFGSGDFTIEMWVRAASVAGFQNLIGKRLTFAFAPFTAALDAGKPRFRSSQTGSTWAIDQTAATVLSVGVWYHLAWCRAVNALRQFINGVQDGGSSYTGALMTNTSAVYVGAQSDAAGGYNGRIDDMRITKGVARYTANFTPPAAPFPDS